MELLEKMLIELLENTRYRSQMKMRLFCKMKLAEKEEKLAKLKRSSTRGALNKILIVNWPNYREYFRKTSFRLQP